MSGSKRTRLPPGMKHFIYPAIDLNTDEPDRHHKPLSAGKHAWLWFGSARTTSATPSISLPGTLASTTRRSFATSARQEMSVSPTFDDDEFVAGVDELRSDDIFPEVVIDWQSLKDALPELHECPEIRKPPLLTITTVLQLGLIIELGKIRIGLHSIGTFSHLLRIV